MTTLAAKSIPELVNLRGKGAVVTGGAAGIGFGIASRLAEAGAGVTIADVNGAAAAFGGIDILVNNAGIFPFRPVQEMSEAEWDRVLDVNLKGAFLCAQAAVGQMRAQGRCGVILNIASIDSLHPSSVGLAHYDASKRRWRSASWPGSRWGGWGSRTTSPGWHSSSSQTRRRT